MTAQRFYTVRCDTVGCGAVRAVVADSTAAVLLCGGPLDRQSFTVAEFSERWHATDYIARRGGQVGPAVWYRVPATPEQWALVPRELPVDAKGRCPLADYAVTPLVYVGPPPGPPSWWLAQQAGRHLDPHDD